MNYLLERIAEAPAGTARRELAERLLYNHSRYDSAYLPGGNWVPMVDWPSKEEILSTLSSQREFYDSLDRLLGPDAPPICKELRERFERNGKQMIKIANAPCTSNGIIKLPACELFPYFGRFERAIKQSGTRGISAMPLGSLTITTEVLGQGGFAEVYKALANEIPYALKLFHTDFKSPRHERRNGGTMSRIADILSHVRTHYDVLQQEPFLAPKIVLTDATWYVLEYLDGQSLEKILQKHPARSKDSALLGRAFYAYARMLQGLHANDLCFVDNNLGAILINDDRVGICDYDFVSTRSELAKQEMDSFGAPAYPRKYAQENYSSQEHVSEEMPLTTTSDLEMLALMIDHAFNYSKGPLVSNWAQAHAAAKKNARSYPKHRKNNLPVHVRDVVAGLVTYPRDNSLTADDFVSAFEVAYGMHQAALFPTGAPSRLNT